jgi:hypothetical protein
MTSAVVSVSTAVRRFIGLGAVESPFGGPREFGSSRSLPEESLAAATTGAPRGGLRDRGDRRSVLRKLLLGVVLAVGVVADVFGRSRAAAPLIVGAQMLECVRLLRMSSMGPAGPEAPGSGTTGVWRPRCPLPGPPAGWMALAIPIDPDWIVALG